MTEFDAALKLATSRRILTLDIETMPNITANFDLKPRGGGYIPPSNVIEWKRVGCFAAKWLDQSRVMFYSEQQAGGHQRMVEKAWALLNQADILVTYNGIRFDVPHLRGSYVLYGMPEPKPWKDVDLIKVARTLGLPYNSLNHLSQRLGIGEKVAHAGMPLWLDCMAGKRDAWSTMRKYNIGDVELTEQVYLRLLPHIKGHPHVENFGMEQLQCPRCGCLENERAGTYLAVVIEYAQYRCVQCKGLYRAGHVRRVARTRGV